MLFPDPATRSAAISLVLDRTQYVAGDTVRGSVHISAKERIECTSILVVARGIETANWNHDPAPSLFRNKENVCFTQEIMVSPAERIFERGEHACDFECVLPLALPGSFTLAATYTPSDFVKYAAASIEYKFDATVEFFSLERPLPSALAAAGVVVPVPPRVRKLHTEQKFELHESHAELVASPRENAFYNAPIRWCCFGLGKCDVKISIVSGVAFPGDHIEVQCDFRNNSCVTIPAVMCRLIQVTTLQLTDRYIHTVEREVGAWMYREIRAREHVVRPHVFAVESTHRDSGNNGSSSMVVQPTTTNGTVVQCRYEIQVDAYVEQSADMALRLPLTVLSSQHLHDQSRESSI